MRISDWSSDVCSSDLLDRLVDERLKAEGERILAEGWKWVTTSIDLPWDATRDLRAIDRTEVPMTDDEQARVAALEARSEEHTSELQSLMRLPYAVFCLKKKNFTTVKMQPTVAFKVMF